MAPFYIPPVPLPSRPPEGCPEPSTWKELRGRGWVPPQTEDTPELEPRNALLMCKHHRTGFNTYKYFIRFYPELGKFVFMNFSRDPAFEVYHGRAIALDVNHPHAPLPSLFIVHEMRVRGSHPFQGVDPRAPEDRDIKWQDWIVLDGVVNHNGTFNHLL